MKIQVSCQIAAEKARCFQVFSDLENLAHHVTAIRRIELLTEGQIGVGTKFKETRLMYGKESSEVMEVTQFAAPDHFREEAQSHGMHYISDWVFSEINGLTTVEIIFTAKPLSLASKITSIFLFFMAGSLRKAFLTDMQELKNLLENNQDQ